MPVTAKLSRKFYDTLGDEIANELVDWFNQVDATYRADLREFNELNFQRFDAKLEQRIGELRSEFRTGLTELRAEMKTSQASLRAELVRWLLGLWIGTVVPLAGLMIGLYQLGH